jgi:hypothetical protein
MTYFRKLLTNFETVGLFKRLNSLTTLCILKKLLDQIDIDAIINDSASVNVSRNFQDKMYNFLDNHVFYALHLLETSLYY